MWARIKNFLMVMFFFTMVIGFTIAAFWDWIAFLLRL
jgi:hypothetical protein